MTIPLLNEDSKALRIGFLGVGRIGQQRMVGIMETGVVGSVVLCDPAPDMVEAAADLVPGAVIMGSFNELLQQRLDGLVIATPSALHAEQSIEALHRGIAVFCQKPLGRTQTEVAAVVAAAKRADRLLSVDLSYRYTDGMQQIREIIRSGGLGNVYAADLVFHNAYGPEKQWFYEKSLSGGGCVMDLGVHLTDLALWALDFPDILNVEGNLFANGVAIKGDSDGVEDFAVAKIELAGGAVIRLSCSWHLHAGVDAVIEASFYGTSGGAKIRNLGGSFMDFTAERFNSTRTEVLSVPPDNWSPRAGAEWARSLRHSCKYDPDCASIIAVSRILDGIYQR
jgi:predicted dehydrogenase